MAAVRRQRRWQCQPAVTAVGRAMRMRIAWRADVVIRSFAVREVLISGEPCGVSPRCVLWVSNEIDVQLANPLDCA